MEKEERFEKVRVSVSRKESELFRYSKDLEAINDFILRYEEKDGHNKVGICYETVHHGGGIGDGSWCEHKPESRFLREGLLRYMKQLRQELIDEANRIADMIKLGEETE